MQSGFCISDTVVLPQTVELLCHLSGVQFGKELLLVCRQQVDERLRRHVVLLHEGESADSQLSRMVCAVNLCDAHIVDGVFILAQFSGQTGVAVRQQCNLFKMRTQSTQQRGALAVRQVTRLFENVIITRIFYTTALRVVSLCALFSISVE